MGMYGSLASLSDATITRLHADPPLVWQIISPDDPDAVVRARGTPRPPGLLARLFGRGRAETSRRQRWLRWSCRTARESSST